MSTESVAGGKTQANSEYAQRIDRVIDYLRGNLDRPVMLADVACFSEFHFHRIFARRIGRTLNWNYACRFGKRQR
jgi:AraC family transcriptional regulator